MVYVPKVWQNGSGGATPISASELNRMEAGIVEAGESGGGGALADLPPSGSLWSVPGALIVNGEDTEVSPGAIYYSLIAVAAPIVVTAARCNIVSQPDSAANIRFGIYAADAVGEADGAPLWDSGNTAIANDFTGAKTISGLSVELAAGYYVLATATSVALSVTGYIQSGARFISPDGVVGYSAAVMSFGAFPSPAPGPLAFTDPQAPRHFFTMQWTNA
jgi:hypothetical protein